MSYKPDPNDSTKQIPKSLPASAFGSAEMPAVRVVTKTTDEVIINAHESGSVFFAVATASIGTTINDDISNSITNTVSSTSWQEIFITTGSFGTEQIKLPINVNVWSGSGAVGNAGDVIFVYKGGL